MPGWAWVVVVLTLVAGGLVSHVVLLLGLYTAGAPDCSAVTAAGKTAHRVVGGAVALVVVGGWAAVLVAIARVTRSLRRIVLAALPLVVAPLLLAGASAALDARMEAIGDEGGSSCF
jgi:hypothetical protein